ncbi:Type I restriction enzyme, partial [Streptococcus pneumoniae]
MFGFVIVSEANQ